MVTEKGKICVDSVNDGGMTKDRDRRNGKEIEI